MTFPPGNGGLSTMRLVCEFEAPFSNPLPAATTLAFRDDFMAERIGWREIVVQGDGATVAGEAASTTVSARLSAYPKDLIATPLDVRDVTITVTPGGPTLAPATIPDAQPLAGVPAAPSSVDPVPSTVPDPTGAPVAPLAGNAPAAIPGGVEGIPSILTTDRLDPLLVFVALLTAAALGAGHALTPGHGKTLMAAYLVGTRGTALHAAGLGLSVSLSHTLGILALAMVVVGAQQALPPDVVVRAAPAIAAITIVLIGGWMLFTELRRWRDRRVANALLAVPDHDHTHEHADASDVPGHAHAHPHPHDHAHPHSADEGHSAEHAHADEEHSHGGMRHRHVPAAGATITWRSLFVLGLAGGLVPSTNALLILLGTIAAGRPAWGVVLVVAFGLGMAAVMGGVGLLFVSARGFLERIPRGGTAGRVTRLMPLGAAVLVLGLGLVLTGQAIGVRLRPLTADQPPARGVPSASMRDLTDRALDTATSLGASYADVRVVRRSDEQVTIKSGRVEAVASGENEGFGVRVLVDGAWGFASSHRLTTADADRIAAEAVRIARASATAFRDPAVLDDRPPATGRYATPVAEDPFTVPLETKIARPARRGRGAPPGQGHRLHGVAATRRSARTRCSPRPTAATPSS